VKGEAKKKGGGKLSSKGVSKKKLQGGETQGGKTSDTKILPRFVETREKGREGG